MLKLFLLALPFTVAVSVPVHAVPKRSVQPWSSDQYQDQNNIESVIQNQADLNPVLGQCLAVCGAVKTSLKKGFEKSGIMSLKMHGKSQKQIFRKHWGVSRISGN